MFSWSRFLSPICALDFWQSIFNPMLVEGGALADTLGRIVGVGPGRGIAVMFLATALLTMFSWSYSIAYLCSGWQSIFNPMLVEGGALADTLGRIVGVGPGRGIAVMFLATALLTIVVVLIASLNRAFRGVEDPSVANAPVTSLPTSPHDQSDDLDSKYSCSPFCCARCGSPWWWSLLFDAVGDAVPRRRSTRFGQGDGSSSLDRSEPRPSDPPAIDARWTTY